MAEVRISGLKKSFGGVEIPKGIDLDIREDEFICFLGPSGCGKSTLLRSIAGLESLTEGSIKLGRRDITNEPSAIEEIAPGWLTAERGAYLGAHLAAQVRCWLTAARSGAGELPAYPHGNDSGWDNASFFDAGGPVASPDLPTFLILCCDALVRLRPDEAGLWRTEGEALFRLRMERLCDGDGAGMASPERYWRVDQKIDAAPASHGRTVRRTPSHCYVMIKMLTRLRARRAAS